MGLVTHATFVEKVWFHHRVAGATREELGLPETVDESFVLAPDDTAAEVRQRYLDACDRSRAIAAEHDLDEVLDWPGESHQPAVPVRPHAHRARPSRRTRRHPRRAAAGAPRVAVFLRAGRDYSAPAPAMCSSARSISMKSATLASQRSRTNATWSGCSL